MFNVLVHQIDFVFQLKLVQCVTLSIFHCLSGVKGGASRYLSFIVCLGVKGMKGYMIR